MNVFKTERFYTQFGVFNYGKSASANHITFGRKIDFDFLRVLNARIPDNRTRNGIALEKFRRYIAVAVGD